MASSSRHLDLPRSGARHPCPGAGVECSRDTSRARGSIVQALSVYLFIYLSTHLSIYLSIYLSVPFNVYHTSTYARSVSIYIYIYRYRERVYIEICDRRICTYEGGSSNIFIYMYIGMYTVRWVEEADGSFKPSSRRTQDSSDKSYKPGLGFIGFRV